METLSVRCNHCGAPLQVAEKTRFVTCQFCQSSLEVRRTESSIFTEEVSKIAASTEKMAESLEVMTLQQEIERLDREHPAERAAATQTPGSNVAEAIIGGIVLVLFTAFGLFFAITSSEMRAPGIFPLVGGGFALIGIIALVSMATRLSVGHASKSDYQERRAELTRRLDTLTKTTDA